MFESMRRCETCPDRKFLPSLGKTALCDDKGPHPLYRGSPGTSYWRDDNDMMHNERFEFWESECSAGKSFNAVPAPPAEVDAELRTGSLSARVTKNDGVVTKVEIFKRQTVTF